MNQDTVKISVNPGISNLVQHQSVTIVSQKISNKVLHVFLNVFQILLLFNRHDLKMDGLKFLINSPGFFI